MKLKPPLLGAIATAFLLPSQLFAADIYVAPNGNDSAAGTLNAPLKTINAARAKAQGISNERININLRAGTYAPEAVLLRNADSGTASNKVIYRSMPGETAFIDGSVAVDSSAFTLVTGSLANRLPNAARGQTYSQVITDPAMRTLLLHPNASLSLNNRIQFLATTPNQGFLTVNQKFSFGSSGTGTFANPTGPTFDIRENIDYNLYRAELERGGQQAYSDGYLGTEFARRRNPIVRLGGTGSRVFVMKDQTQGVFRTVAVSRFRIANMLSALDSAGEWFFDKVDNRLYFWPLAGSINANDRVAVSGGKQAFIVINAKHLIFQNIVFQNIGGASATGAVIDIQNGENIEVGGCTFRRISLPFAPVATQGGARNNLITSSDFYDNGRGVILGGGSFNTNSVTAGNNVVENSHFALWQSRHGEGNAVSVSGAGNIFRDNLCHNASTQSIIHSGVDHFFARNEIFNVGYEEGDGGAAYTGANLYSFGNTFRHNFVHHLISVPGLLGRAGFFSDDYDAGETYDANVFYKCGGAAVKMNAGSGHTVTANVLIENLNGVSLLGRPETYNRVNDEALRFLRDDPNANRKENYLGRAEKILGDFANNANGTYNSSWNNSFWAQRYPILRNMLSNTSGRLGMFPSQVRVYDNGFFNNATNFKSSPGFGAELRSKSLNNGNFVNPSDLNFRFTSVPSGMKSIPFDSIGLQTNFYRKSIPNKTTYRRAVRNRWSSNNGRPGGSYNSNTANNLVYYNTGALIVPASQSGLVVREGDAAKNQPSAGGNTGGGNTGGGNSNNITVDTSRDSYNYDAGTTTSPLQSGDWVRLSPSTTGDVSWSGSINSLDRGANGNPGDLNRDLVFSNQTRVLSHKIANGTWTVTLSMGDQGFAHNDMRVRAEGAQVVRNNINNAAGVFTEVSFDVNVSDGELNLEFSDQGGSDPNWVLTRVSLARAATPPSAPSQGPFGGTARSLTDTLQVEDYDTGGQGVAYNDLDTSNNGGQGRTNEGVDLANAADTGSGLCIGWTQNTEWTEYTVNVAAGTYNVELRTAAQPANPGGLQMSLNGTNLGTIDVTNSGGWQTWQTDTLNNITVPAANNGILRLTVVDGAGFNINWIKLTPVSSGGGNTGGGSNNGQTSLTGADIGNTSATGSTENTASGNYTLRGSGADIWGTADAFHYASDPVTASTGTITARVASVTNTWVWAKAGVHYRDSNAPGAKNVGVYVRPDGQVAMQWRTSTNGTSAWNGTLLGNTGFAKWVRLTKNGDSYTGEWSTNGTNWNTIRSITINMGNDNSVGLAVTATNNNGDLNTSTFTNVFHNWETSGSSTGGGSTGGGSTGGGSTGGGSTGGGSTGGGSTGGGSTGGGSTGGGNTAFGGSLRSIPGLIEAEDFDTGANGTAYSDTSNGNEGPDNYRNGTDVDLENRTGDSNGHNIGWVANNEWTEYSVNATAGTYNIEIRAASNSGNAGDMRIELDGANLGTFPITNTGGWATWQVFTLNNVSVSAASNKKLRLTAINGGSFNWDWVRFTAVGGTSSANASTSGGSSSGGSPQTVNATPSDDAYLRDGSTRYNSSSLRIDASSRQRTSYLKFNVTGVNGTVSGAKLVLKVTDDAGSGTISVHQGSSNSWTEGNLSSSNAPAKGALLGTKTGTFSTGSTQEIPLSGITGNGVITLIISLNNGGNDVKFSSSEGADAPKLEVTSQ